MTAVYTQPAGPFRSMMKDALFSLQSVACWVEDGTRVERRRECLGDVPLDMINLATVHDFWALDWIVYGDRKPQHWTQRSRSRPTQSFCL